MKKIITILTALCGLAYLVHSMEWNKLIHKNLSSLRADENSLSIGRYQLQKKVVIPGIYNLSGVVYHPQRKSLFMVLNNPETLLECNLEGNILQRFELTGFHDTEGLCFDAEGNFTIVEEQRQALVTLTLPVTGGVIDRRDASRIVELALYPEENIGFEGVSYSQKHQSFFIAKEKEPAAVFQLSNKPQSQSFKRLLNLQSDKLFTDDMSDLFCKEDGGFLILSDESALVTECSFDGEVQSYLELDEGFNGLKERIPQAEGLCLDDEGNLYIVSEPNILYIYRSGE
ncbi:MAG: SdiA-regulated domain-containing protein [Lentisphaeraceae bacterium]|nr:SdiA-regulated domain-containing protein [Lentisphaeraceae bacterium]